MIYERTGPNQSKDRNGVRSAAHRSVMHVVMALIPLVLVVWSLVRIFGPDDPGPGDLVADPGVSHVHGLGINPADGALFVATHFGMFRIADEGSAQRVGDSFQDTMGFTVAGPDDFLGSGHPDAAGVQQGKPGLLGLIGSTDAGETWENLSLSGEVDFHGLAYAHGRAYGWDSTNRRFMISEDQRTWDDRATLDLYGFAVDPDDARTLVGAAPGGVRRSTDDGRTWVEPSGPPIVAIAWAPDRTLWGVEASGAVQRSDDGGDTWAPTGRLPGQPQALLAAEEGLWAAAKDGDGPSGIYRSTDGGGMWDLRYQDEDL